MSKIAKLTKEQRGDFDATKEMLKVAKKEGEDLRAETRKDFLSIKNRKIFKPIIKKLYEDEKISEDKYDKLLQYLIDKDYKKLRKELKKFPDYYKEEDSSSDSSSEDEKPKKKMSKTKGQGIMDYLNQF